MECLKKSDNNFSQPSCPLSCLVSITSIIYCKIQCHPVRETETTRKKFRVRLWLMGHSCWDLDFLPRLCILYCIVYVYVLCILLYCIVPYSELHCINIKYTRLLTLFVHTSRGSNCSKEERCFAEKIWWVLERLKTETLPVEEVTSITRLISVRQSDSWYLRHLFDNFDLDFDGPEDWVHLCWIVEDCLSNITDWLTSWLVL